MESLLKSGKQVIIVSSMEELIKVMKLVLEEMKENEEGSNTSTNTSDSKVEELLTVTQFSKLFQISETTVHKWKNEGLIPYIRIKSRIRFKKSEILKLYEKRRLKRG